MAKSKYQAYETETISRDMIKNAPYNPRIMDEKAKKRLKKNIQKHGLVSALTWNKRTGNLVGGHQRLEQLDALEKSKDYDLTVCVVDVDEREEATLNVQLNNPSMQGEWDIDLLANLSEEYELDMKEDLGFTESDVDFMFDGDDRFSRLFDTVEGARMRDDLEKVKEARKQGVEKMKQRDTAEFYVTIVFENKEDKDRFLREISIPVYERYVTEDQVRRLTASRND